jgi:hypothetical protein
VEAFDNRNVLMVIYILGTDLKINTSKLLNFRRTEFEPEQTVEN